MLQIIFHYQWNNSCRNDGFFFLQKNHLFANVPKTKYLVHLYLKMSISGLLLYWKICFFYRT